MSINMYAKLKRRDRRKVRVRKRGFGTDVRPRLSEFRRAKHIYAQVIDDVSGKTLAAASTLGKASVSTDVKKVDQAKSVGVEIAKVCTQRQITAVVFDRNGFRYHGRVR